MPWLLGNQEGCAGSRPPHHAEAEEVRRRGRGAAGSHTHCPVALACLCQRDPFLLPKKARAVWSGSPPAAQVTQKSGFLPQNYPKAQCVCEDEQGWAAFIANMYQGAEYLALRGLLEMPSVFGRDWQWLPASHAAMSRRDVSSMNTHLYLISTYGVIYPVFYVSILQKYGCCSG